MDLANLENLLPLKISRFTVDPYLACCRQNSICNIISLTQHDYKNTILNPKIHCKFKNTSGNNYIPEFLTANSVVVDDGEFLLEWCKYFGQPQVWYISYVTLLEPLI